jgi:hypothetical protein
MRKLLLGIICLLAFGFAIYVAAEGGGPLPKPANGYVPDKKTAISIAAAVLTPLLGSEHPMPKEASLSNGVWTVTDTFTSIQISKDDGRILGVSRWK